MTEPIYILIVDGDDAIRQETCRVLEMAGYLTLAARTVAAALLAAREHHPALIILNRKLPDIDGMNACRQIKGDPALRDAFVVLATGVLESKEAQTANLESGVDGHILLPIGDRELVTQMESFVRILRLNHALREMTKELRMSNARLEQEAREAHAREAELATVNASLQEASLAALNLIEDTEEARGHLEEANAALMTEIEGRKKVEAALRGSEERFSTMLEQNVSAMFVVDDGILTYANKRFGDLLDYPPETLVGRSFPELVAAANRPQLAADTEGLLSGAVPRIDCTFAVVRRDGAMAEVGACATRTVVGGRVVMLGSAEDIGERRKAQVLIEQYVSRLERSIEDTLRALSTMVEMRDPYTAGHERRVGELAAAIGAEMGLSAHDVKWLRLTGYVHDIGKITIPAEILSKPSRLSPVEFELIKMHSVAGHGILAGIEFPWPVVEVILEHHERMDGSGYPRGLRGAGQIRLESRIMAVADVVEAMSSHRPYRPGKGIEAALAEIEKNAGLLYDPDVAAACLRLFREKGYVLAEVSSEV